MLTNRLSTIYWYSSSPYWTGPALGMFTFKKGASGFPRRILNLYTLRCIAESLAFKINLNSGAGRRLEIARSV